MKYGQYKPEKQEKDYDCTSERPDDLKLKINYLIRKAAFTEETLSGLMNIELNFYGLLVLLLRYFIIGRGFDGVLKDQEIDQIKDNLAKTLQGDYGNGEKKKHSYLYQFVLVEFEDRKTGIESRKYIAFITGINDKKVSGWRLNIKLGYGGIGAASEIEIADLLGRPGGNHEGLPTWTYFNEPKDEVEIKPIMSPRYGQGPAGSTDQQGPGAEKK